jgi:hypothetical protein
MPNLDNLLKKITSIQKKAGSGPPEKPRLAMVRPPRPRPEPEDPEHPYAPPEPPDALGPPNTDVYEKAAELRRVYLVLSACLNERMKEVMGRLFEMKDGKKTRAEYQKSLEGLVAEIEDLEALIAALDGLVRNLDNDEILDDEYVSEYLGYCLELRREGRTKGAGEKS